MCGHTYKLIKAYVISLLRSRPWWSSQWALLSMSFKHQSMILCSVSQVFVQGVIVQVSFIMKASPLQQLAVPRFRLLVSHSCGSSRSPKRNDPEVDLSIKRCKNLITTKSYTPNRRLLASSHLEGQLGRVPSRNLCTRWAAKAHGGCPRTHFILHIPGIGLSSAPRRLLSRCMTSMWFVLS